MPPCAGDVHTCRCVLPLLSGPGTAGGGAVAADGAGGGLNPAPAPVALEWAASCSGSPPCRRSRRRSPARVVQGGASSRGGVCRAGLWRYSRHPNYFFEWLVWVAYALYASASPSGALAWTCPAVMLFLLFRVTGIPATEAQAVRTRGDAYRRYQRPPASSFRGSPRLIDGPPFGPTCRPHPPEPRSVTDRLDTGLLPDPVLRAIIRCICASRLREQSARRCGWRRRRAMRRFVDSPRTRRSRHMDRAEPPALRGARRLLRAGPRPAPEIQLRLVAAGRHHARRRRGADARAHVPCAPA